MVEKVEKRVRESDRQVDTVAKALTILNCFSAGEPELSLKALSEITGLYKSRIMRLCGTLIAQGFLVKTSRATYQLGPRVMILGKIYEESHSLFKSAQPVLEELVHSTGESAAIFMREGMTRFCVIQKVGPSSLRYSVSEGEPLPLHAGAPGKVLLAWAPENIKNRFLEDRVLRKYTSRTIIAKKDLERELDSIRRRGYAVSEGEVVQNAVSIAAPIFDHESNVTYAIHVGGPAQRLTPERQVEILPPLEESARRLSFLLGKE
ncbi:MAG: IclR family transcriptional regulator [bacterium]|nr:MAG: IclR family transcriptional regulator [bacterium]